MRQRFYCLECGVRMSGRLGTDGNVYPYDRGPDSDEPPKPMLCGICAGFGRVRKETNGQQTPISADQ